MNNIINFNFNNASIRTCLIKDSPYFSLRDICKVLKINNRTNMKNSLDEKGVYSIYLLTTKGKQKADFINEKNLYKVIFKSRMQEAERFQDWVFEDVLPTIRKTGGYNIEDSNYLLKQTDRSTQLQNSKDINSINYNKGGVEAVREYNRLNCLLHSGKTPSELKKEAKIYGLKSKQRTSGKEVLRNTKPELACTMSLTDEVSKKGLSLSKAYEITKDAIPIYSKLIKLGIDLPELNK